MPIEKRWVVKPQGDRATVEALATQLGMSTVLTNLLVQRGIDTAEKAKKFFSQKCCIERLTSLLHNCQYSLFCLHNHNFLIVYISYFKCYIHIFA